MLPAILNELNDKNSQLRSMALQAIGRIGPEKTMIPVLTKLLSDESEMVRTYSAQALGTIGPEAKSAVPRLITLLRDENPMVGSIAVWCDKIGPDAKDAIPALKRLLEDPEAGYHNYGDREVEGMLQVATAKAIWKIGGVKTKELIPVLTSRLKDQLYRVRRDAAQQLGDMGPEAKSAIPAFTELLNARLALSAGRQRCR